MKAYVRAARMFRCGALHLKFTGISPRAAALHDEVEVYGIKSTSSCDSTWRNVSRSHPYRVARGAVSQRWRLIFGALVNERKNRTYISAIIY